MVSADVIRDALDNYGDAVYKLCLIMLKNHADAADAAQETFITYMDKSPLFTGAEKEKAWLMQVAANKCRDMLRMRSRRNTVSDDILENYAENTEEYGIVEALTELPDKYRIVMILHYIEGYKTEEIAGMIGKTVSAVKMRLSKGRTMLRETYRKEYM